MIEQHAADLNISAETQRKVIARLDALEALERDPWLSDEYEAVEWFGRLITADGGG